MCKHAHIRAGRQRRVSYDITCALHFQYIFFQLSASITLVQAQHKYARIALCQSWRCARVCRELDHLSRQRPRGIAHPIATPLRHSGEPGSPHRGTRAFMLGCSLGVVEG